MRLCSLRFVDSGHNAVIVGPVRVGNTFLATALGRAAIRRRHTVHFERCDRLLKRLRASRLDNSHDLEVRKVLRVDLLIADGFALQALDPLNTADIDELIVERHRAAATIVTSRCSGYPRWPFGSTMLILQDRATSSSARPPAVEGLGAGRGASWSSWRPPGQSCGSCSTS